MLLCGAPGFLNRSRTLLSSCSAVRRLSRRGPGLPETHLLDPEIVDAGSSDPPGGSSPGDPGTFGLPTPGVAGPLGPPGSPAPRPRSPMLPVQATTHMGAPIRQNFLRLRNIACPPGGGNVLSRSRQRPTSRGVTQGVSHSSAYVQWLGLRLGGANSPTAVTFSDQGVRRRR